MFSKANRKPSQEDLCSFFRIVRRYSIANIPLPEALDHFQKNCVNSKMKEIVTTMISDLKNGLGFSEALKRHVVFPSFAIEMIRIGEETGQIPSMLEEIVFYLEQNIDIQRKLSAGLFPVKLFLTGAIVAILVAVFIVIPKFKEILEDLNAELPFITQIVMGFGGIMSSYWPLCLFLVAILVLGYGWLIKAHPEKIDRWKLMIPFYKEIYLNLIWYRMTKVLALIARNNITPTSSFRYAAISVGNVPMKEILLSASAKISNAGLRSVDALKWADRDEHLLNNDIYLMLHAGEESGNISKVMGDLSEDYRKDLLSASANIGEKVGVAIIIPTFVILFIILGSVYAPILSMMSAGTGLQ